MRRTLLTFAASGLALALAVPVAGQAPVQRSALHDYRVVTVVEGLVNPWSIAFLPGGEILVTEKPGRLRVVRNGRLAPDPVTGVPDVFARGQGGLLDVVPHPNFARNRLLYISYSKPMGSNGATTAIIRGRYESGRLTNVEEIFEAVTNNARSGHYGSRIVFDGNGYLFASVGDRQARPSGDLESHPAQDPSNHHGTIVRLHEDGRVPNDNPFVGQDGFLPSIWSYGHRNPQGMARHPETGDLWANEHGPQGGDELNLIQPGLNYGWPVVGYGVNYGSGARIHDATMREGMENPVRFWVPSIATSGLLIYTGDKFPGWRGNLFIGGMNGQRLVRLTMDGQDVLNEETLVQRMGRVRDVRQGPDGYIYLAIDDRRGAPTSIVRLEPTETTQ